MLRAILFDMDGTITRPHIDWPALRARLGVPRESNIIEHLDRGRDPVFGLRERIRFAAQGVVFDAAGTTRHG